MQGMKMSHLELLCAEAYEEGPILNQITIGTECTQVGNAHADWVEMRWRKTKQPAQERRLFHETYSDVA
jgi:hypothetical protein